MGKGNKYFTGNAGKVWISDKEYMDCYKAEAKRTDNYEAIPDNDGNGEIQVFTGFSIDGSLTIRKTGNEEILKKLADDKNGDLEISIIIKEENPNTGVVERKKYIDCTITEFPLSMFEKRTITEIELPFKARDYEVLQ